MSTILLNPACIKTLSAVEALPNRSNQHEFNGVAELRQIFGLARFSKLAKFSIRGALTSAEAEVTWYDARESHPKRTEYRLYFKANPVMARATEGDSVVIGFQGSNLHVILIPSSATSTPAPAKWTSTNNQTI